MTIQKENIEELKESMGYFLLKLTTVIKKLNLNDSLNPYEYMDEKKVFINNGYDVYILNPEYIKKGYFEKHIEKEIDSPYYYVETLVTKKGLDFLIELFKDFEEKNPSDYDDLPF